MICEHLDLKSLMNLAKAGPYTHDAASFVFKSAFSINSVEIDSASFYGKTLYEQETEIDHLLNILESFGHLISQLTVDYSYLNNKHTARFNKIMKKTGLDSLTSIDLRHCDHRKLRALPKPLKNVKNVSLHGQFKSTYINVREFFPSAINISLNDEKHEEGRLGYGQPEAERTHEIDGPLGFIWKFLNL